MLDTGSVPVGDKVHRLPTAAQGERKATSPNFSVFTQYKMLTPNLVKGKAPAQVEEEDEEEELRKLQAEMAM
jgi:charged multivesicular body protein 4